MLKTPLFFRFFAPFRLWVLLSMLLAGAVVAQTSGPKPAPLAAVPPAAMPAAKAATKTSTTKSTKEKPEIRKRPSEVFPKAEWPATAEKALAQLSVMVRQVEKMRQQAAKGDALKLDCLNIAYARLKGLLQVAENARKAMNLALAVDPILAAHDFDKVIGVRRSADQVFGDAHRCVGADVTDATAEVEMLVDDTFKDFDPYYGDVSFFFDASGVLIDGGKGQLGNNDPNAPRPPDASGVN